MSRAPKDLPAGDERRDAIKAVADENAEKIESLSQSVGAVDPSKLEIDREIAFEIVEANTLAVAKARPDMEYRWIRGFDQNGRAILGHVAEAQATRVRTRDGSIVPVWEVVNTLDRNMPEAPESKDVNGWRRCGDCILIRAKKDVLAALTAYEKRKNDEFLNRHVGTLNDMGNRHGIRVTDTHGMNPRDYARARGTFRQQGAEGAFNEMLEHGVTPKIPAAQAAR